MDNWFQLKRYHRLFYFEHLIPYYVAKDGLKLDQRMLIKLSEKSQINTR